MCIGPVVSFAFGYLSVKTIALDQGDQIGRIIAFGRLFTFGTLLKIKKWSMICYVFHRNCETNSNLTTIGWALIWATFSKNHPVALIAIHIAQ
jgi:hypothetical protein